MSDKPPITYYPPSTQLIEVLKETPLVIPWQTSTETRDECFMSDSPRMYAYGSGPGARMYTSVPMEKTVKRIMNSMNFGLHEGSELNVCFLNRYANERQHLGWHSDDSWEIDQNTGIGVLSFGAEREIWFRPRGQKGEATFKQKMEHGSMIVMEPGMQAAWVHKIPKHPQPCGERISLTFRRMHDRTDKMQ